MWTKYCHHYVKNCAKLMSSQVMNFQFTYLRCRDPKVILLSLLCQVITRLFFLFFLRSSLMNYMVWDSHFFCLSLSQKWTVREKPRVRTKIRDVLRIFHKRLKGGWYVVWLYWNFNTRPRELYICVIFCVVKILLQVRSSFLLLLFKTIRWWIFINNLRMVGCLILW